MRRDLGGGGVASAFHGGEVSVLFAIAELCEQEPENCLEEEKKSGDVESVAVAEEVEEESAEEGAGEFGDPEGEAHEGESLGKEVCFVLLVGKSGEELVAFEVVDEIGDDGSGNERVSGAAEGHASPDERDGLREMEGRRHPE